MQENIKTVLVKKTVRNEFKTANIVQYDVGHVLSFEGFDLPEAFEVHFSLTETGEAVTQVGSEGKVAVPDILVQDGRWLYAWLYISDEETGLTKFTIQIPVTRRAKPTDQVPSPVEQDAINQAIAALNTGVAKAETAAENAEQSEENASQYAENSHNSSNAAESAAESAEVYARTATQKAQDASESAQLASRKASDASSFANAAHGSAESALYSAQNAQESAQSASNSAQSAQGYAQTSGEKATEATQSASNAAQKAQEALSSAQAAEGSANDADTAKRGAETARDGAQGYAGNASASAEAAVAAKNAAVEKAGEASQSANNAAQSAQAAAQTAAQFEEDITQLKSDIEAVADTETVSLFSDNGGQIYTSSTFSGFSSSYEISEKKTVTGLTFFARSRAGSNIDKVKIRIESDDGSFVYERTFDVNIGDTIQEVTVPVKCIIPEGLVWIAVAANKIATFYHDTGSNGESYYYWTDGNISDLSRLKEPSGATRKLFLRISYIKQTKIKDGQITEPKLSFAEFIEPKNLLNIDDEDQCKIGWWYYSTAIGSVITPQDLHGQYAYTALKAKTYGGEKITIDTYPRQAQPPRVYWVGAADKDMRLLSYSIVNQNVPVTYTVPEGTVYILASPSTLSETVLGMMMIVKGETVTEYVKGEGEKYLLKRCVTEVKKEEDNYDYLKIPDSYNLVVGDTFQLFKKGIVNAFNPDIYDVQFVCTKGTAYERFFEITPTVAETIPLDVVLYDAKHEMLASKTVNLVVSTKKSSPSSKKYVLCVGDSLTTGGVWPKELNRRLTANDGTPQGDGLSNVEFIGTREYGGVNYEGYGGWTFGSYNTENVNENTKIITCTHDKTEVEDQHSIYKDANNATWKLETIGPGQIKIIAVSSEGRNFPATGTLTWVSGGTHHSDIVYTASQNAAGNPFWDSTQSKVDFAAYCSRLNVPQIDYVVVLLGWNNASSSEANYKENAQTFINNVLASYPSAKILLMGLQIPARDGLGANYGANGSYADYYGLMQYVFNLDDWYEDLADGVNVYHINLAGQFDTENNMPTSTRQVNSRNSQTEAYQSNGVHPSTSGQMQIADAAYRFLESVL